MHPPKRRKKNFLLSHSCRSTTQCPHFYSCQLVSYPIWTNYLWSIFTAICPRCSLCRLRGRLQDRSSVRINSFQTRMTRASYFADSKVRVFGTVIHCNKTNKHDTNRLSQSKPSSSSNECREGNQGECCYSTPVCGMNHDNKSHFRW